jgi:hypothetical protein
MRVNSRRIGTIRIATFGLDPSRNSKNARAKTMSTNRETILDTILYIIEQVPLLGKAVEIVHNIIFTPDHWEEVKANAEAMVNSKISEAIYSVLQGNLQGLSTNLTEYFEATIHSKDNPQYIGQKFMVAQGGFNQSVPLFQQGSDDQRVLLLPLFAQVVNMHLILLREGAISGGEWGFTEQIQADLKQTLARRTIEYGQYVTATYQAGWRAGEKQATNCVESFNATYGKYHREMTLNVLEYAELWQYLASPVPVTPPLNFDREIYSDAFGSC